MLVFDVVSIVPLVDNYLRILTPTTAGLVMIASAFPPALVIYWLRDERHRPAVVWFQYAMLSGILWSLSFGLISLISTPPVRLIATNFYIVAVPLGSIFTFMYCYEFTFKKPVPRSVYILFIPVLAMFIMAWFNPYDLIYTVDNPYQSTEILIPANPGSVRPLVTVLMSFPLVIMGGGMVVGELMRSSDTTRKIQASIILFLIVITAVLGMTKVLDLVPPYFDPTPIGWTLAGFLFAVSIKRYQFLQVSPAAAQQIMDELTHLIYVLDPTNTVTGTNEIATAVLDIERGMTNEELEQRNPELERSDTDGRPDEVTISIEGDTRVFTHTTAALEYGYGAEGEVHLLRDVTELAAKEDELRKQNERLSDFANEVSHDLRNPLNVAVGHTQLAKESRDVTEHVAQIEQSLERMDDLIQSILARAHSGRHPDRELLSVETIAETAWGNVQTSAASLETDIDQELYADSGQLLQLFENLFRNSQEHSDGSVQISIGSTPSGFYVADNGPGIPQDRRKDVFQQGVTYADHGTGYGLSIVSNVVAAHEWSICVGESESGGARFDISGIDFRQDN